jgi:hypothetical protein
MLVFFCFFHRGQAPNDYKTSPSEQPCCLLEPKNQEFQMLTTTKAPHKTTYTKTLNGNYKRKANNRQYSQLYNYQLKKKNYTISKNQLHTSQIHQTIKVTAKPENICRRTLGQQVNSSNSKPPTQSNRQKPSVKHIKF